MKLTKLLLTLIFSLLLLGLIGCKGQLKPTQPADAPPTASISPEQLFLDYKNNEVAADLKYKNKVLQITGKIEKIAKNLSDEPYIVLDAGKNTIFNVQCFLPAKDTNCLNQIAEYSKGQTIIIKGECVGKVGNVLIKQANIGHQDSNGQIKWICQW